MVSLLSLSLTTSRIIILQVFNVLIQSPIFSRLSIFSSPDSGQHNLVAIIGRIYSWPFCASFDFPAHSGKSGVRTQNMQGPIFMPYFSSLTNCIFLPSSGVAIFKPSADFIVGSVGFKDPAGLLLPNTYPWQSHILALRMGMSPAQSIIRKDIASEPEVSKQHIKSHLNVLAAHPVLLLCPQCLL